MARRAGGEDANGYTFAGMDEAALDSALDRALTAYRRAARASAARDAERGRCLHALTEPRQAAPCKHLSCPGLRHTAPACRARQGAQEQQACSRRTAALRLDCECNFDCDPEPRAPPRAAGRDRPDWWADLARRNMGVDCSWERAAGAYLAIYNQLAAA